MSEVSTGPAAVRTIRIIWMAILVSLLVYALVIFMAVKQPAEAPWQSHFSNQMVLILHVLGFGTFVVAAFIVQDPRVFLPLGALAAIGILASYPSDDRLREMAAQSA